MKKIIHIFLISLLFSSCDQIRSYEDEKYKASKYDSLVKNGLAQESKSESESESSTSIYKDCIPSVVTIMTDNDALGSGFFVSQNVIATNYHLIKGSSSLKIKLANSGELFTVSGYVGVDIPNDLILLACNEVTRSPLIVSNSVPETGEQIFVIGSPLGLEASFSNGIISGIRNTGRRKLIQLTAPISPGNSGGPVLNAKKEVIGISVMSLEFGQNLNFAVPSQILNTLISFVEKYPRELSSLSDFDDTYFIGDAGRIAAEDKARQDSIAIAVGKQDNIKPNQIQQVEDDLPPNGEYAFITSIVDFSNMKSYPLHEYDDPFSRVIYPCPPNSKVYVIDNRGIMYTKIYINGHMGYIANEFLKSH